MQPTFKARGILKLGIGLLVLAGGCFAQSEVGGAAINGTVTDPSGGSVPNAKVMVKNTATGLTRNSQTSDPVQVRARNGYVRGLRRLSPVGPPMQEWLLAHDPVAAARQSPAEFERRSPAWWRGTRSGPGPRRSWPSAARA